MFEIGRLCLKIAGRDAGKKCLVIDIIDNKFVMIDGETRRRKCNVAHLEPLDSIIKIKKNASHDDIKSEFKEIGLNVLETTPKQKTERPKKMLKKEAKKEKTAKKGEPKKAVKKVKNSKESKI